jgi:hypothetical protein
LALCQQGCASSPFPVPEDLQTNAEFYEVPLANEGTTEFGPYRLQYRQLSGTVTADEYGRTQFVGRIHLDVERAGEPPASIECEFDEFFVSCDEPGSTWTMTFGSKKLFDTMTKGEIDDGKTKYSSSALFVDHGLSREWVGYTISLGEETKVAISRSKLGRKPQLWIASDEKRRPHLVAAAIALLSYDPTLTPKE